MAKESMKAREVKRIKLADPAIAPDKTKNLLVNPPQLQTKVNTADNSKRIDDTLKIVFCFEVRPNKVIPIPVINNNTGIENFLSNSPKFMIFNFI